MSSSTKKQQRRQYISSGKKALGKQRHHREGRENAERNTAQQYFHHRPAGRQEFLCTHFTGPCTASRRILLPCRPQPETKKQQQTTNYNSTRNLPLTLPCGSRTTQATPSCRHSPPRHHQQQALRTTLPPTPPSPEHPIHARRRAKPPSPRARARVSQSLSGSPRSNGSLGAVNGWAGFWLQLGTGRSTLRRGGCP